MIAELTARMIEFNAGEPALTQHFLKVYAFAQAIGRLEGLPPRELETLEMAALTHDIGIKVAMQRYGKCNGKMQEEEGPIAAKPLLEAVGADAQVTSRVCYLIGHHHTYTDIDGLDYRILVEADFLVNLFEGNQSEEAKQAAYRNIFRTETGKRFFRDMFGEVDA